MALSALKLFTFSTLCFLADCKINLFEVTECKEPVDGKGSFTSSFDADHKTIDVTIDFPFDVKEDDTFTLKLHKFDQDTNDWVYNEDEKNGDTCFYIQQFLSKAWDKARSSANPKIEEECVVPKGKYEWKDFKLQEEDVIVPAGMSGRFKLDVTLYGEEPLFCFGVDVSVDDV